MSKKNIIPELIDAAANRRSFVKKIGLATAAVGAMGSMASVAEASGFTGTEYEVLNFALNLEYLEASFYTYAVDGTDITTYGIGINGRSPRGNNPTSGGAAMGGAKVNFSNSLVFSQAIAAQIADDERMHVKLLRSVLGDQAVARPVIDLNALGFGFGSQDDFLLLARVFEDIGVTAYAGAAGLLSTPVVITTAARILAAEAEHSASIRVQVARLNVNTSNTKLDGVDILPPPTGSQQTYLSIVPGDGLVATRTPQQVLYLAYGFKANATSGGFYPNGINHAVIYQSGSAATPNSSNY